MSGDQIELDTSQLDRVKAVVQEQVGPLDETATRCWQSTPEVDPSVTVRARGGWFHIESPLPRRGRQLLPGPRRAQNLLRGNALLPPGVRHAVGARSRAPYLVADMSLRDHYADTQQMVDQVQQLCGRFLEALQKPVRPTSQTCEPVTTALQAPMTVDDPAGELARQHCASTGWAYHERGNGQLAITLDAPAHFCQAYVYGVGQDEFRLGTSLEIPSKLSAKSQHATATLLLTATRMIRMARATVVHHESTRDHRWEVSWAQPPTAAQFHGGLSALSIACRLTLRELQALADEAIAETYLRLRARDSQ